jgi:PPP family 3-phenylpropionic acid transporter
VLARLRLGYFTHFLYLGTFGPLWTIYVTRGLRLSSAAAGWLALLLVTGLLGLGIVAARIADRRRCRRRVQRVLSFLGVLTTASWLFVPDAGLAALLMLLHGGAAHVHSLLLDASTIDVLGPDRERYGTTRLFGTLGYGTAALLVGQLRGDDPGRIIQFAVAFMALFHAVTWWLPDPQSRPAPPSLPRARFPGRAPVFLLGAQLLFGVASAPYEIFGGCYFEDLGMSPAFFGRLLAVGILSEVVVFAWSPRWLQRIAAEDLATLALLATAARWLLLPHLRGEPLLLLQQTSHGLGFGLWYGAALQVLCRHVPAAMRTVGQAAFGITLSVGYGAGGALTGLLREGTSAHWLYAGAAIVLLAASGLLRAARIDGLRTAPAAARP